MAECNDMSRHPAFPIELRPEVQEQLHALGYMEE